MTAIRDLKSLLEDWIANNVDGLSNILNELHAEEKNEENLLYFHKVLTEIRLFYERSDKANCKQLKEFIDSLERLYSDAAEAKAEAEAEAEAAAKAEAEADEAAAK